MMVPIGDKVILKPIEEARTAGGILIPDTDNENTIKSRVVAVGPGRTTEFGTVVKPEVKEGDIVLYNKNNAVRFEHNYEEYHVIRGYEIITILNEE